MSLLTLKALFASSKAATGYLIVGFLTLLIGLVLSVQGLWNLGNRNPIFVAGPLLLAAAILCFIKTAVARLSENKETGVQQDEGEWPTEQESVETQPSAPTNQTALLTNLEVKFLTLPNGRVVTFISDTSSPNFSLVTETNYFTEQHMRDNRSTLHHMDTLPPYSPRLMHQEQENPEIVQNNNNAHGDLPSCSTYTEDSSDPPPYSAIDQEVFDQCSNMHNISLIHAGPPN